MMKDRRYFLNTVLAAVVAIALGTCTVIRAFAPAMILPKLDIPNMVLLSLVALLVDYYAAPGAKRNYIFIPIFALLTFGVLPLAVQYVGLRGALPVALIGCVVFTATTWIFSFVQDRLATGPVARLAPILSAFGLYLAAQCFAGIGL